MFFQNVSAPVVHADLSLHKEKGARSWTSSKGKKNKPKADANFKFNEYHTEFDCEIPENHLFSPSLDIRVED